MILGQDAAAATLQIAEQKIDIQAAFVRFVNNDGVVLHQQASCWISASRIPSVISLTIVLSLDAIAETHFVTDATAWLCFSSSKYAFATVALPADGGLGIAISL